MLCVLRLAYLSIRCLSIQSTREWSMRVYISVFAPSQIKSHPHQDHAISPLRYTVYHRLQTCISHRLQ
jgi:hypothetical protein